jgi:hypothetical protein
MVLWFSMEQTPEAISRKMRNIMEGKIGLAPTGNELFAGRQAEKKPCSKGNNGFVSISVYILWIGCPRATSLASMVTSPSVGWA